MAIEWIIIYVLSAIIISILLVLLSKIIKIKSENMVRDISGEVTEKQYQVISTFEGKILDRIGNYNENQMKILFETKANTFEKLQKNATELSEAFNRFQSNLNETGNNANTKITETLTNNFNALNKRIEESLDKINNRVEERLNEGFEKTNKTFLSIVERLTKIDEAQKKIDSLSTNIVSLQEILTDKKSRGTFGEVQLSNIIQSILGDKNDKVYQLQKKLSNGKIADAVLLLPEPVGMICVDSKFPLENYRRMIEKNIEKSEKIKFEKEFKINVKNHIDAIGDKYIISEETSNQAIMFVPAEAVFAEINAYHDDLIDYARKKNVWIASPTTLMSVLSTVQIVLRNIERDKYTGIIHEELNKLGIEFKRYKERWDSLAKDISKVHRDVSEINTTSGKIEKRFDNISKVKIEKNDNAELVIDLDKYED